MNPIRRKSLAYLGTPQTEFGKLQKPVDIAEVVGQPHKSEDIVSLKKETGETWSEVLRDRGLREDRDHVPADLDQTRDDCEIRVHGGPGDQPYLVARRDGRVNSVRMKTEMKPKAKLQTLLAECDRQALRGRHCAPGGDAARARKEDAVLVARYRSGIDGRILRPQTSKEMTIPEMFHNKKRHNYGEKKRAMVLMLFTQSVEAVNLLNHGGSPPRRSRGEQRTRQGRSE